HPFIAQLPQRLLSHPRGGALAVVSQVSRMWSTSFGLIGESRIQVFEGALRLLVDGYPLGFAMEFFNQRFAELAVELTSLWEDRDFHRKVSLERFGRLWMAAHDARNLVVFGDPAVRMSGTG
ncbi:MAG TPA: hypothetical protein VLX28_03120, partial [Thermoanaerobaculia bacterium]|nr:hypothetical protein [Thermoanaerobaculia bacterium]